jgi:hypothetical protein
LPGARVVRVRDRLAKTRALPKVIVLDNRPEMRGLALDDWAYRNRVRLAALGPGLPDTRGIRFTPSRACPGWHETKRKSSAILSTQTIKPSDRFLGHVKERPLKWLVAGACKQRESLILPVRL